MRPPWDIRTRTHVYGHLIRSVECDIATPERDCATRPTVWRVGDVGCGLRDLARPRRREHKLSCPRGWGFDERWHAILMSRAEAFSKVQLSGASGSPHGHTVKPKIYLQINLNARISLENRCVTERIQQKFISTVAWRLAASLIGTVE